MRLLHAFVLPVSFAVALQAQAQRLEELDTPFVTTPDNVLKVMLDVARVEPGDRLIDLGSGDGRIVIAAARRGAQALGVEIDPKLVERSRVTAQRAGLQDRARFAVQDLFDTDFRAADVVTLYLLPDVNARLRSKFYAELRPGARIVSHDYDLGPDWPPDRTIVVDAPEKIYDGRKTSRVHYWLVPARLEGRWNGEAQAMPIALDLVQRYQRVSGSVQWRGREWRFADARIAGRRLVLALSGARGERMRLTLVATGEMLVGHLASASSRAALRLQR